MHRAKPADQTAARRVTSPTELKAGEGGGRGGPGQEIEIRQHSWGRAVGGVRCGPETPVRRGVGEAQIRSTPCESGVPCEASQPVQVKSGGQKARLLGQNASSKHFAFPFHNRTSGSFPWAVWAAQSRLSRGRPRALSNNSTSKILF